MQTRGEASATATVSTDTELLRVVQQLGDHTNQQLLRPIPLHLFSRLGSVERRAFSSGSEQDLRCVSPRKRVREASIYLFFIFSKAKKREQQLGQMRFQPTSTTRPGWGTFAWPPRRAGARLASLLWWLTLRKMPV